MLFAISILAQVNLVAAPATFQSISPRPHMSALPVPRRYLAGGRLFIARHPCPGRHSLRYKVQKLIRDINSMHEALQAISLELFPPGNSMATQTDDTDDKLTDPADKYQPLPSRNVARTASTTNVSL